MLRFVLNTHFAVATVMARGILDGTFAKPSKTETEIGFSVRRDTVSTT